MSKITIIGAGVWGTALGQVLSKQHQVTIWGRSSDKINSYAVDKHHEGLPSVALSDSIHWTTDKQEALKDVAFIILAIPTQHIRSVLSAFKDYIPRDIPIIQTAKGIEITSGMLVHQVTRDIMPDNLLYILSGPGFAIDVARSKPTALSLAGTHAIEMVQALFAQSAIRPYAHHDMIGVALGGALKNILAIAAGFCMGYDLGEGAKAAIITRGFNEILQPVKQLGGDIKTLYGLSGLGDLMLTANSPLSRNYQFGMMLGRNSYQDHKELLTQTTEGYYTLLALQKIIEINKNQYPIFSALLDLMTQKQSKDYIIAELLERPLKEEF